LLKYLTDLLNIGMGFERLIFFSAIFMVLCHVLCCVWVIAAEMRDEDEESWLDRFDDTSAKSKYISSIYFTITTITTVGYGDISGQNSKERVVSIAIMIVGVISFSFATGSLSSILQNYDHANAKLSAKMNILNQIYSDYFLPLDFYERLRQAVRYDYHQNRNDVN
jgi:hypothetical protein